MLSVSKKQENVTPIHTCTTVTGIRQNWDLTTNHHSSETINNELYSILAVLLQASVFECLTLMGSMVHPNSFQENGRVSKFPRLPKQVSDYFNATSIHGLTYIAEEKRPAFERILWALMVITGLIFSGFFIALILGKFLDSPTYTTVADTNYPIWHLDFPAISVCPNIRIDNERLKKVLEEEPWSNLDPSVLDEVLPRALKKYLFLLGNSLDFKEEGADLKNFVDQYHQYIPKLLRSSIYSCRSLFENCKWQGIKINCSDLFKIRKTDLGYCCSFNSVRQAEQFDFPGEEEFVFNDFYDEDYYDWIDYGDNIMDKNKTENKKRPTPTMSKTNVTRLKRTNSAGTSFGLAFSVLTPESSLEDYSIAAFDGFKIQIHNPYDFPEVEGRGLAVAKNQVAFIGVSATLTKTTDNVKSMSRQRRNCFLSDEDLDDYYIADGVKFKAFANYTQKSCLLECQAHLIHQRCSCIPHYFPNFLNSFGPNTTCNFSGLDCLFNHKNLLNALEPDEQEQNHKLMEGAECNCPQQCDETVYLTEFSQVPKSSKTDKETLLGNPSDVYVYFKQFGAIEFSRDQLYSLPDLIGALGGILGLFVGFSFLSGVELIYWFTFRLFNNQ